MIRFKDIQFIQHKIREDLVRYNGTLSIGPYDLSVSYGDTVYGSGPDSDTYEVAIWDEHDIIPLSDQNDVLGWTNSAEIDQIIRMLHDTSNFGTACRVFKETRWSRRFNMIGEYKYQDELVS